jgi:hypothetical protein
MSSPAENKVEKGDPDPALGNIISPVSEEPVVNRIALLFIKSPKVLERV